VEVQTVSDPDPGRSGEMQGCAAQFPPTYIPAHPTAFFSFTFKAKAILLKRCCGPSEPDSLSR
jgi:hypothetical protein